MRLSDAIREGAKLHPQCFSGYHERDFFAGVTATCAIGAAMQSTKTLSDDLMHTFPILSKRGFDCPACSTSNNRSVFIVATHLNDDHKWSREQIADWVETVEPKGE